MHDKINIRFLRCVNKCSFLNEIDTRIWANYTIHLKRCLKDVK
jgi:hypothetical protein